MLSAEPVASGVIVIDGTVPASIASTGVPAVHDSGTRSPGRCLANDQVDDTRFLTGIVRIHIRRVESNIAGIHDEPRIALSLRIQYGK